MVKYMWAHSAYSCEGIEMPAIPIRNEEEYCKIIEVLDRVGGTWQGVGDKEMFFLVSPRQYQALVEAKAVDPEENGKESKRGTKARKRPKS
jgi:hypothetical protein